MSFKPSNRHLLLREIEEETIDEIPTILVPDDYNVKTAPYGVYEVVDMANDCTKVSLGPRGTGHKNISRKVVVPNNMVESVSIHGETLLLILENHVMGVIE
tara:strand:+ start:4434 stop:4736 length:303 start_codon:yes stop_codon:yes gene_type:complete